ncbi:MAG: ABC transporter ATP-binding protein [Fimbriimonadaceae bacterium]|nr:ABC transporter ATP-binding protein [Fimbriimonadaceae bacterium]
MTEQDAVQSAETHRENSWKAFRFVLRFLKPQVKRLILVCLIDISISLVNLAIPWFGKFIIDEAFPQRDWNLTLQVAAGIALLAGMVYGLSALRTYLYNTAEMLIGLGIRRAMYGHLQKLSIDTVESVPVGQQQFRITTDADRIAHMLVRILPTAAMLVEFALILSIASYIEPVLTMIVMGFLIPWTILFIWVTHFGRIFDRRRLRMTEMRDSAILQSSSSFSTIKAFSRVRSEIFRNGIANISVQRVAIQGYLILVGFELTTQKLLPYLKSITIYLFLIRKVIFGEMTLGMTVPLIAYLSRVTYPLERIVNFGCWIWQTMVSAERLMHILQTEPAIQDRPDAKIVDSNLVGTVSFEGVSFERPNVGKVLSDVSFEMKPGTTTAVVGPSGAGKSTALGLMLRFQDPSEGRIVVSGEDLRDLDRTSYLRHVGTVMQETFVFAGSVAENLRITKPDATDEELLQVLETVELREWVESLNNELDQDLESGNGLSAGQKQRIGIARAILPNPQILLLDEPTSALDVETEAQLIEILRRVGQDRTTFVVTHRLETILDADQILVLDRGVVVERGTHNELLASGGLYADLYRLHRTFSTVDGVDYMNEVTQ